MSSSPPEDLLLLIRCPSCGQRFKIGEDLRDRTVECGNCEHRFRIEEDTIVRGRKFYPSDKKRRTMSNFQRLPLPASDFSIGVQSIQYSALPDSVVLEPTSPQRVIAGIIGVAVGLMMGLLLMFGGGHGGTLDGMDLGSRLLIAIFTGMMSTALLVYANPRTRMKAVAAGVLLSGGLISEPFVFNSGYSQPQQGIAEVEQKPTTKAKEVKAPKVTEDPSIVALRNQIGTGPLVAEIAKLAEAGSRNHAVGLWLRGLSESNRFLVRDYILRVTGADSSSHYYPRDGGDYLLVVTGITQSLSQIAALTAVFGETEHLYPELSLVEVRVNPRVFIEQSIEKLSKKDSDEFYPLNKAELENIDLDRVKRAVQRLAEVEPKLYRVDITRKLLALLGEDGIDFKESICRALETWSVQPGAASEAALKVVNQLFADQKPIPSEIMSLIVKEKNTAAIPVLDALWFKNPAPWESLYADLGPAVEAKVIERFPQTQGIIRYSAVRILGRVGGRDSLPVLEVAATGADSELKVLLEQATNAIHKRLGK